MIENGYLKTEDLESLPLARRDWLVLPAIGFLTIVVLITATEAIARKVLPKLSTFGEDCMIFDDAATGARAIPGSVCRDKLPDTELTEYRFDACGHRSAIGCGPKPPGTYQIVMLGSSIATGMRVPVEKTFATLLPEELSRRTGNSIRLYNEGVPWRPPRVIAQHIDEVLKEKPDLILWILTAADIGETSKLVQRGGANQPPPGKPKAEGVRAWVESMMPASLRSALAYAIQNQATGNLLRIQLYRIRTLYVHNYLMRGDEAEFLQSNPSPRWSGNLDRFDQYAGEIETKARLAGIPVVAAYLPIRAQSAMLSMGSWPAGSDPDKLNNDLRGIVEKNGGVYLDILPAFRAVPDAESNYYPVDGHPNASGHVLLTRMLADAFTQAGLPNLHPAAAQPSAPVGH